MTAFDMGRSTVMASKQPQEVIGSLMSEYALNEVIASWEFFRTNSLTPTHWPSVSSMTSPFLMGWLGPVGVISNAALPSSQLYAPHRPGRSGLMTHTWSGAKDWQSVQE